MKTKDEKKAKGGRARAAALSPEKKREIAMKAAAARWGILPQATHKGNFKEEFGIDVDCYVLDDASKTAVINQRGMGAALGMGAVGSRLPRLVNSKRISDYVGPELRKKLKNPLIFQSTTADQKTGLMARNHGYDVTILIDVCKAIYSAEADGRLHQSQKNIARQAHIILNASAKAGIKGLVYALAGYDVTKEETIAAFKLYVREEAREYEREFPSQLYDEWYRLYQLPRPERNRPWKFKHLTIEQVYRPLARSNGKLHELVVAQRAAKNERWKKLHQFFSEIGVKALRTHLGQLLGIAQTSASQGEYESHVERIFGIQQQLEFPDDADAPTS